MQRIVPTVFKPCRKDFYTVIHGFQTIKSPTHSTESVSRTIMKSEEKKPARRRWKKEEKEMAISIGKKMGLSKATRYLQNMPEFKELCPSTLYYWIKTYGEVKA